MPSDLANNERAEVAAVVIGEKNGHLDARPNNAMMR